MRYNDGSFGAEIPGGVAVVLLIIAILLIVWAA